MPDMLYCKTVKELLDDDEEVEEEKDWLTSDDEVERSDDVELES